MEFNLKVVFDDTSTEWEFCDPTIEEITKSIEELKSHTDSFCILDSSEPIESFVFIQAFYENDNKFHTEVQFQEGDAAYQYCSDKITENQLMGLMTDFIDGKALNIDEWECMDDFGNYKFYKEFELRKFLRQKKLNVLKVKNIPQNAIYLDTSNINDFLEFTKNNDINTVFYYYCCINKDKFDITKIRIDKDLSELASGELTKYREEIEEVWDESAILYLFCFSGSAVIAVRSEAKWLERLMPVEDLVDNLNRKYSEEMELIKSNRYADKDNVLEELQNILVQDSDFALCSNKSLREDFMRKFLLKADNQRYYQMFLGYDGYLNSYELQNFTDRAYAVYKLNKRK